MKTSVTAAADRFGLGAMLAPLGTRLTERAAKLEIGGEAEITKWDAQSQAQGAIIRQGAKGLDATIQRLQTYALQYGEDLNKDAHALKLPAETREILRADAELWVEAINTSDTPKSAEGRLRAAGQHSLTLEIDIMEASLSAPQAAAHNAAVDKSDTVNADLDPASLGPREIEMRKKLGRMRSEMLAGKLDKGAEKTTEETRQLVFESQVVLQAAQHDALWRMLDDADGFWAHVTFDATEIKTLKVEGKTYYQGWKTVYDLIRAKDNKAAREAYEKLCANGKMQTFLTRVQEKVADAQRHAMIAKLIAMIVITIASMGVGTLVEGFVAGGAAVAEGATAVTTGLGLGRTAGTVAGFLAETTTFTLASNFALEKDHSIGTILTEFGKNLVLFGAMRGIGAVFKAAGAAKVIEAGMKEGATTGAVLKGGAVELSQAAAMGGVGVIAGYIEAKIKEKISGQKLSDAELKNMIRMTVAQTLIMVVVGRVLRSPLQTLKLKAGFEGAKWRMARSEAASLKSLATGMDGKPATEGQLRELVAKDLHQIELEKAAFEEVRAKMEKAGTSTTDIDKHLDALNKHAEVAKTIDLTLRMKEEAPGHFTAERAQIPDLIARHQALGSKVEPVEVDAYGAKTYRVTSKTGEVLFISEQLPDWAATTSGKRLVAAAQKAKVPETILWTLTEAERSALLALERAVEMKSAAEIERARSQLGRLSRPEQEALLTAMREGAPAKVGPKTSAETAKETEAAKKAAELARIRNGTPGKVRTEAELSNADVVKVMNEQLQHVKPGEVDEMLSTFTGEQRAQAQKALARSSGFGKMESLNQLRDAMQPHLDAGKKLYTPGSGSLADNVAYVGKSGTGNATGPSAGKGPPPTTKTIDASTIVILDDVVLARMKEDPAFAKSLVDKKAVLLQPRGFSDGNNMYNAPTPEAIKARLTALLERTAKLQATDPALKSFDDALTAALDKSMNDALAKVDPAVASALRGQLEVVDPGKTVDTSSAGIAEALNDNAGITEAQLAQALAGLSPGDQALLREFFAQRSEVFSSRRQTNELLKQHQQMQDIAQQKGISPKKVYYFIYKPGKSYGMIAMAHHEATGTPTENYINGPQELAARQLGPDTMLVIFDDVAGSGESLRFASEGGDPTAQGALQTGYRGKVVVAPMISTQEANTNLQGDAATPGSGVAGRNPSVTYAPARIAEAVTESGFFKSLPPERQRALLDLLNYQNAHMYERNGLNVAFPYMAPDNNNVLWAKKIAPEFIANKNPKASKNSEQPWVPPAGGNP